MFPLGCRVNWNECPTLGRHWLAWIRAFCVAGPTICLGAEPFSTTKFQRLSTHRITLSRKQTMQLQVEGNLELDVHIPRCFA